MKPDLLSLTRQELRAFVKETLGEPAFRGDQIFAWLHRQLAADFDAMTNLPAALRERLKKEAILAAAEPLTHQVSRLDGTEKYLFAMADGEQIESVLMRYRYGLSLCISSQAGCRMGCSFCASTLGGLSRDLTAGEMLAQVYGASRGAGERIGHLVVMGTGEPLDNYDNLLQFLRILSAEEGQHLSLRNITVSTCGLVPQMRRLAQEKLPLTLALSLHAPTDEKRRAIMPIARKYPIEELMEACAYYFDVTGRRVTFEYSLIHGVNDLPEDALALSALARRVRAHVNLIPVNPVRENNYEESPRESIERFRAQLEKNGVNVSIRRVLGRDIDGACGQLRHKFRKE